MSPIEVVQRPDHLPQRDQLGEAPFWDGASGALFWVDIVGRRVHRYDPSSGDVRMWRTEGHVSGVVPSVAGDLVISTETGLHRLAMVSGATRPFAAPDDVEGNRSNECRADPQGRLWLGTMFNNLAPDGAPIDITTFTGGLFCIEADGRHHRMLSGIGIANTLCWTPDRARLYFADTLHGAMWSFASDPDQPRLSDRRLFLEKGSAAGMPDGSAVDEDGCLWNARWGGGRIVRFTPSGAIDREILLPVEQPSCVAFGDTDRRTLYVTTARQELEGLAPDSLDGAVFALRVDVAGMPSAHFAG